MKTLSDWCDLQLASISWSNLGRDLSIFGSTSAPESQSFTLSELKARWASELKVDLNFGEEQGGLPLVWQVSYGELPNGRKRILLDFGCVGSIEFVCNEFEVLKASKP